MTSESKPGGGADAVSKPAAEGHSERPSGGLASGPVADVQEPHSTPEASTSSSSTSTVRPSASTTHPTEPSSSKPPSGTQSLSVSASHSASASPLSSRDHSPSPHTRRQPGMGGPPKANARSRKNSGDVSPHRITTPTAPSAAAIQRALASASTPQLQNAAAASEQARLSRLPRAQNGTSSDSSQRQWTSSPRVKSPPPSNPGSRRNSLRSQRKQDSESTAPNIIVQNATPNSGSPARPSSHDTPSVDDEPPVMTSNKPLVRGHGSAPALETVQEASLPNTPFGTISNQSDQAGKYFPKSTTESRHVSASAEASQDDIADRASKVTESGSESSSGNKSDGKRNKRPTAPISTHTSRTKLAPSGSYTSLSTPKAKTANENMTVETETVSSIPQASLTGGNVERPGAGRGEPSGSVRLKPSTETIRPKKERRKAPTRKQASVASGTASSKADVFEAKVASAVGEANSSDSDETFVYESNPPEVSRPSRHHSRTPSATSMQSFMEHGRGVRSMNNMLDANRAVAGKRSMKFANNPYHSSNADSEGVDRPEGTVRAGHSRSSTGAYHGRPGYGTVNTTFSDNEIHQPPPLQKRGLLSGVSRQSSRPTSPRIGNIGSPSFFNSKKNGDIIAYDMDGEGADDERAPLIGTVRTNRSRASRRPNNTNMRQMEHYQRQQRGWMSRFAGCVVLIVLLLLLIFGVLGFIFATTKPLYDVSVREINGILVSEQELMLDLRVQAINPNIIGVSIEDMDINIFAKSKHVGGSRFAAADLPLEHTPESLPFRRRRRARKSPHSHGGVDEGTDPIEDPEGDSQTMLLGRIFHFDSALSFEGSPVKRHPHYSTGEVRLAQPGNKTEAGGSERWERVLQYPFQLIVRGVLRYQLPLTNHRISATVGASVLYRPEEGVFSQESTGFQRLEWVEDGMDDHWIVVEDDEDDDFESN